MGVTMLDVCKSVFPELRWRVDYQREGNPRVGTLEDLEVSLFRVGTKHPQGDYEVLWRDGRKRSGSARHPTMRGALEFVRYGLQGKRS